MVSTQVLNETVVPFSRKKSSYRFHPGYNTMRNWAKRGLKDPDGKAVTLEWCHLGGTPVTSIEALVRFHKLHNGE